MKKVLVLGLGIAATILTVGSVFASTPVTTNSDNCTVSIESKKEVLNSYVSEGKITREKADEIVNKLENCDGTESKIGQTYGVSFGQGNNGEHGNNEGQENGNGMRRGLNNENKNTECTDCTNE